MTLFLDMPIPPSVAGWLRERGHDAVHAEGVEGRHEASERQI
jgi:predicted nuclease of predicted toxin-antitoxin system